MRNAGIDLLRILAIFTVVVIHTAAGDIAYRDGLLHYMPLANACFAFLAGWFLFNPSAEVLSFRDIGGLLGKRLGRLMIPYLLWEGIYFLANIGFDLMSGKFNPPVGTDWIGIVFFGSSSVQLWFVITLVYAQLVLCCIMAVMAALKWNTFKRGYPMALLFILLAFSLLLWRTSGIEIDYLRRFAFLLGYGALGIGFRRVAHEMRGFNNCLICRGAVFVAGGLVIASWFLNVPEVVLVLAWCLVFGCMPIHASLQKCLSYCSGAVMGIYLCHVCFTRMIAMGVPVVSRVIPNGYALVLVNAIIGFVASLAFVLLLKRTSWRWMISI